MTEAALRQAIVDAARAMTALGINQGTSGNISVRFADTMLITPSATPYDTMIAADIAAMPLGGDGEWSGPLAPSTEWRMHRDILLGRPDAAAIVHAHPIHCTALAIARRGIPACHYMIAAFGGDDVRCAPYAGFGTALLARHALAALDGRTACLLANHGMVTLAGTLARAMWRASELETLARQYLASLGAGGPVLLSRADIDEALASFTQYGHRDRTP